MVFSGNKSRSFTTTKKYTSGSQLDMNDTNDLMKSIGPTWKQPAGYAWHHIENSTRLKLLPSDLHGSVSHSGGRTTYILGIRIELQSCYRQITQTDIDTLNDELDIQLPSDYAKFLLRHNGGQPKQNHFSKKDPKGESIFDFYLNVFFGIGVVVHQRKTGGDNRLDDDQGGHLIGHRFMGDQGAKNLFPQNANLNQSAYKRMENEWADWTKEGFEVRLKVKLDPPNTDRPDSILSKYEVIDPKSGDVVYRKRHNFDNTSGQQFERIPMKDMKNYRG